MTRADRERAHATIMRAAAGCAAMTRAGRAGHADDVAAIAHAKTDDTAITRADAERASMTRAPADGAAMMRADDDGAVTKPVDAARAAMTRAGRAGRADDVAAIAHAKTDGTAITRADGARAATTRAPADGAAMARADRAGRAGDVAAIAHAMTDGTAITRADAEGVSMTRAPADGAAMARAECERSATTRAAAGVPVAPDLRGTEASGVFDREGDAGPGDGRTVEARGAEAGDAAVAQLRDRARLHFAIARVLEIALVAYLVASAACGDDTAAPTGDDPDAMPDPVSLCGDVPVAGVCMGRDVHRCVDGAVAIETCNTTCTSDGDVARCVGLEVCSSVGPLGRCEGELLWRCDGAPSATDCAASGQICGYRDDDAGYACLDPATTGAHRVAGTITWEDRALAPGSLADPVAKPARGVMVAVVDDASNELIAIASAADDGSYVAHYDATGMVRVVTYSRSRSALRPARVRDTSGYLHAVGGTPFAAGAQATADVHVTAASTAGGAWNALDNAVTAMDWLRAHGVATLSPVYMYWQRSTSSGSYYLGANNQLHLDGDDGFDDVVALHELGHYMQDEYSDSDNPGGAHDGSPADPRLAWGEGGATWFAIAIRGEPYYIDWSTGGGWAVELEDRVHEASLSGSMSQNVSEWMVAEVMWDLTDDATGDADSVDGNAASVWDVLVGYLVSQSRVDRGRAGLDLVEFLDGWFEHGGMSTCGGMRALVRDKYNFPYDFAGPAGVCP